MLFLTVPTQVSARFGGTIMSFRLAISSAAALLVVCSPSGPEADAAIVQDERPQVSIETIDLGDGLYMLSTGMAGNLALLTGADGAVMIDDQLPNMARIIETAVIELTGENAPRFLINTHWHGDHTGNNALFANRGSMIAAHHNVRTRIEASERSWASDPAALPIMTFGEDLILHLNGQTIEVTHLANAHTDGDAIVYFREADVLHMGDIFFSGRFSYIDLVNGGSVDGVISALEYGLGMAGENTRIIPGHGPLSTRTELQAVINMLRETSGRVRQMVQAGDNLDDIGAANLLADYSDWNWGISSERMLRILYEDAMARR